ncbi:CotH kinase family protein [Flavobacterium sp. UBA7680]|uniref:CotH kinase family protein n=1 Tax=Flavobacterium sp. UBA7680 TaxID=1946559 RepID=UPI0025BB6218|nr:CotH kinase family protein [Flavobacterium sp. UBA7680]
MKQRILLFFLFFSFYTFYANQRIDVPSNQYGIDNSKSLIITNLDVNSINSSLSGEKSSISFDVLYNFKTPVSEIKIGIPYSIVNTITNKTYTLYFTQLPLIRISTENEIIRDESKLANFELIESNKKFVSSKIGISYRGETSYKLFEKKPYEINFWNDDEGKVTHDESLLGMHSDDGWNLQAMYNEPLRFNNKTGWELWRSICTPYYSSKEPEAVSGIQQEYAELFLNGEYQGLYCVGEKVNRKLLKLKKYNEKVHGELYKAKKYAGATLFRYMTSYDNNRAEWSGYECKYPNEVDWSNLYKWTDFVINNFNAKLYNDPKSEFRINNDAEYFIFLNLIRATDNLGKNFYIAKYNSGEPFFFVPWDLDATFGNVWNGDHEDVTDDLQADKFFNLLLNDCSEGGFCSRLSSRWKELRKTVITHDKLMLMFTNNYNVLKQNGAYERESLVWNDYKANSDELNYISQWLTKRIAFLDKTFGEMCGGTLDVKAFDKVSNIVVYPNPTSDMINISSKDNLLHTVFLYDSTGKLVLTRYSRDNEDKISIKHLSSGIYFLKVVDEENKIDLKKIIKE